MNKAYTILTFYSKLPIWWIFWKDGK